MSKFVHVQWWDEQAMVHDEVINTRNIEKVYLVLPERRSLRMVERDRNKWLVRKMLYTDERECDNFYKKILKALVEE